MTKAKEERAAKDDLFSDVPELHEKGDAELSQSLRDFDCRYQIASATERESSEEKLVKRLQKRASSKRFKVIRSGTTGSTLQVQVPYPLSTFCKLSDERATSQDLAVAVGGAYVSTRVREGKYLQLELHGLDAIEMAKEVHQQLGRCIADAEAFEKQRQKIL